MARFHRQFLGLPILLTLVTSTACPRVEGTVVTEMHSPHSHGTSVIDPHAHFFDGYDFPALEFLNQHLETAPLESRRSLIMKVVALAVTKGALDRRRSTYKRNSSWLGVGGPEQESLIEYERVSDTNPKGAFRRDIDHNIRYLRHASLTRTEIALDYIRLHPDVSLSFPHLVDADGFAYDPGLFWVSSDKMRRSRSSFHDRAKLHSELADRISNDGRLDHVSIPVIGFSPLHDVAQYAFDCQIERKLHANICWDQQGYERGPDLKQQGPAARRLHRTDYLDAIPGKDSYPLTGVPDESYTQEFVEYVSDFNSRIAAVKLYPPFGYYASDNCSIALRLAGVSDSSQPATPSQQHALIAALPEAGFGHRASLKRLRRNVERLQEGAKEMHGNNGSESAVSAYYPQAKRCLEAAEALVGRQQGLDRDGRRRIYQARIGLYLAYMFDVSLGRLIEAAAHPHRGFTIAVHVSDGGATAGADFSRFTTEWLSELADPRYDGVLSLYPDLRLVLAHAGTLPLDKLVSTSHWGDVANIIEKARRRPGQPTPAFPNTFADVSMFLPAKDEPDAFFSFYRSLDEHTRDQLIFGTDYYMNLRYGSGDNVYETTGLHAAQDWNLRAESQARFFFGAAVEAYGLLPGQDNFRHVCRSISGAAPRTKKWHLGRNLGCP